MDLSRYCSTDNVNKSKPKLDKNGKVFFKFERLFGFFYLNFTMDYKDKVFQIKIKDFEPCFG